MTTASPRRHLQLASAATDDSELDLARRFAGRLFLKVSEVAEITQTDPRTVRHGIELGQVPGVRIGEGAIRVPAALFWPMAGIDPVTLRPLTEKAPDPSQGPDAEVSSSDAPKEPTHAQDPAPPRPSSSSSPG